MKKIIIVITLLLVVTILLLIKFNNEDNECYSISGGSFGIIYNTNGGESLELSSVCIACPPNSYSTLPVPTKEGYTFDGWYYDKEFTKKVDGDSTLNVEPNPILEKGTCITGYNNVTIYAKWK